MTRRYFDWAATSPPDPQILTNALSSSLSLTGNPSSRHAEGRAAKAALEQARTRCAAMFGVGAETLFFTSGGTEANNLVLQSVLLRRGRRGIIASAIEHPSTSEPLARFQKLGLPVAYVRPASSGQVQAEALRRSIDKNPETAMISVMGVNNETGALIDIPALAAEARRHTKSLHFHCDAVQALGKVPIDLRAWDVDSASFSAHKIGGPRGIGLLYSRNKIEPLYAGGEQEGGIRPGTENVFGAIAFAAALEKYADAEAVRTQHSAAALRFSTLIKELKSIDRCTLIPIDRSENDPRFSPFILQAAFAGIPGEVLVRTMDDAGFAISTGSACSSASKKRPVLEAMGVDEKTAFEAVRLSQGFSTTEEDIAALLDALRSCLRSLR